MELFRCSPSKYVKFCYGIQHFCNPTLISQPNIYQPNNSQTVVSQPNYVQPQPNYQQPNYDNQISQAQLNKIPKIAIWLVPLITIGILGAIAVPSFVSQGNKAREGEAKTYISSMVNAQLNSYEEDGKFQNNVNSLGTGINSETDSYSYEVKLLDENSSILSATPKKKGLHSYLGVTFINNDNIISGICKTKEPSLSPPQTPELTDINFQCSNDAEFFSNPSSIAVPEQFSNQTLTKEEAVAIIKRWYEAKSKIFAYPFDLNLVEELTTGQLYYDTTKHGGSVDWLKQNSCYYTYDYSTIENVLLFDNQGIRPALKIGIHEQLRLNGFNCGGNTDNYRKNVTYWFEKDNGVWKIYAYDVE